MSTLLLVLGYFVVGFVCAVAWARFETFADDTECTAWVFAWPLCAVYAGGLGLARAAKWLGRRLP